MRTSEKKDIDFRFIFLYFIGIVFVTMGHKGSSTFSLFQNWFPFYNFHLALFMFCSGYFYKRENEDNAFNFIKKKIKKLLVVALLWNFIYGVFLIFLRTFGFSFGEIISFKSLFMLPLYNGHQFVFNMGTWYVIPLLSVEIFNVLFRKYSTYLKSEYVYFLIYFILGLIGIFISNHGLNTNWWLFLTRMLYFLPFYALGILYNFKLETHDSKINNHLYFCIIFISSLLIINYYGHHIKIVPSWCIFPENILLPFILGFLGIAFWLRIAKIFEPLIKNSKIILLIANNTYPIVIHQFLAFFIIGFLFGLLSNIGFFNNEFIWEEFKTNIWYTYYPNNLYQWGIIYIIGGLFIPILINTYINKCILIMKNYLKNMKGKKYEKI